MDISKIKVSGTSYDIKDASARSSISSIDSIVQGLANVASSGSYNDLSDTPTIGSGILTIQKNGTTVDTFSANATSDKTINITIPAAGTLNTTATTAQSTSASEPFGGNITLHKIAKTGTFSDLIGKPTKLSDFTNDSGFITSQDLVTVMDYKGTKATVAALPSSGNKNGDVWHVTENNAEYAWNGSAWEELGTPVDLSGYATIASLATVATTGNYSDLTGTPDLSAYVIDYGSSGVGKIHGNVSELEETRLYAASTTGAYVAVTPGGVDIDTTGLQTFGDVSITTRTGAKLKYNNNEVATVNQIPTVNNAALTMQKNGTTVKTFTANASSVVNLNITMQYGGTTGTDAETLILNVA